MAMMGGRRGLACGGALLVVLAGCASVLGPLRHDEVQRELDRNRALWSAQGVTSYEYVVERICFCSSEVTTPVRVRVQERQVVERSYTGSEEAPDSTHAASRWPAVEGLFGMVQDAIDQDAHAITVEYHPQMGYPAYIWIDYHARMADDEQGVRARELVPHR